MAAAKQSANAAAIARWRAGVQKQGLVRVEVLVYPEDKDAVKAYATKLVTQRSKKNGTA